MTTDPFDTTHCDRTGQTRIEEETEMTDHLDRAAEVIAAQMHGLTTPSMCRGIARALEEAGMLVSPERPPDGGPRPMPEFSPERARLLAERPAHPWTPPDGPTPHRLEDVAAEFDVDLTEGEKR